MLISENARRRKNEAPDALREGGFTTKKRLAALVDAESILTQRTRVNPHRTSRLTSRWPSQCAGRGAFQYLPAVRDPNQIHALSCPDNMVRGAGCMPGRCHRKDAGAADRRGEDEYRVSVASCRCRRERWSLHGEKGEVCLQETEVR